tara:strand:- start:8402 stop:8755 length:354 start_codon:yes stop_codon:yes gene_type:complete
MENYVSAVTENLPVTNVLRPTKIQQIGEHTLGITWNDGHESCYPVKVLREACECAVCVDEWSGENRIMPGTIPDDVHPIEINPVGLYGIRIDWSDGHNSGIYTFPHVRSLCSCQICS